MTKQFKRFVATTLLLSMALQSCTSNLKLDAEPKIQIKQPKTTEKPAIQTPPLEGGQKGNPKSTTAPSTPVALTPIGLPSKPNLYLQPTGAPLKGFDVHAQAKFSSTQQPQEALATPPDSPLLEGFLVRRTDQQRQQKR